MRVRDIAAYGTSSDRQLAVYHESIACGADQEEALRDVVDHLIAETTEGL